MCRIVAVQVKTLAVQNIVALINQRHLGHLFTQLILPDNINPLPVLLFKFEDYRSYQYYSDRYPDWFELLTAKEFLS